MGVGVSAETWHGRGHGLGCKNGRVVEGKDWAGDACSRSYERVQPGEGALPVHETDNTDKKTR